MSKVDICVACLVAVLLTSGGPQRAAEKVTYRDGQTSVELEFAENRLGVIMGPNVAIRELRASARYSDFRVEEEFPGGVFIVSTQPRRDVRALSEEVKKVSAAWGLGPDAVTTGLVVRFPGQSRPMILPDEMRVVLKNGTTARQLKH